MQLFDGMGYSSMYSTLPNGTCPSASPTANLMPYYGTMFRWRPDKIPTAQLSYVCKSYPTCGTLMTCVLAKGRFATELNLMLKYSDAPVEEKKKTGHFRAPWPVRSRNVEGRGVPSEDAHLCRARGRLHRADEVGLGIRALPQCAWPPAHEDPRSGHVRQG